jgi:VanZ family protein
MPSLLRMLQAYVSIVCASVLGALSLLPAGSFHRTTLGNHTEHAIAYAAAAFLVVLAQREHPSARALVLLILYAAVLEYMQRFSPGRTPHMEDFLFSALGVLMGGSAAWAFRRLRTAIENLSAS